MSVPCQITISRPHGGGKDVVNIALYDPNAAVQFIDLEMSLANFAEALLGLGHVDCDVELRGAERVGKIRETRPLEFTFEHDRNSGARDARDKAKDICQQYADEGWFAATYFGSKGAVQQSGDTVLARTSQYRWVDQVEPGDSE